MTKIQTVLNFEFGAVLDACACYRLPFDACRDALRYRLNVLPVF